MNHESMAQNSSVIRGGPMANARLGVMLFIAAAVMLFAVLVAGFLVLRFGSHGFAGMPSLPGSWNGLLFPVLLVTLIALMRATVHLRALEVKATRLWIALALASSVAFLVILVLSWKAALAVGIAPGTNVRFGLYYLMTGAHGVHALGGVVPIVMLAMQARRGGDPHRFLPFLHATELYWRFVIAVGLVLFVLLYVIDP